jgi:predicted DNA-binding antitoxin AbrB/MazE fold protein
MKTIHAIYEDGVFKPTEPVDLPDHCPVKVEPQVEPTGQDVWNEIYGIMSERYRSGESDVAARHNEHQP